LRARQSSTSSQGLRQGARNILSDRVGQISAKYGFRQSPVLDQFFLIDEGILSREARYAELSDKDTVLEVGPGFGFLTSFLAHQAGRVVVVERDKRLEPILKAELAKFKNIEFIFADFLEAQLPQFNKIVSNIPYSISAPLTFRLLDYDFERAILCYQKEFAEKMVCGPGTSDYGRLSVMAQYYFDVRLLEVINKSAFQPQPKVDSAVVSLVKKPVQRDQKFDAFIREIFRYPNKDVRNSVKIAFGKDIQDDRKLFTLGIPDLVELYKKVG
jgi:16S rRNA (adenine1518-N6/adenine1519-N6)-dimethyltransferase